MTACLTAAAEPHAACDIGNPKACVALARPLMAKDPDAATGLLSKACYEAEPNDIEACVLLAELDLKQGDRQSAGETYAFACELGSVPSCAQAKALTGKNPGAPGALAAEPADKTGKSTADSAPPARKCPSFVAPPDAAQLLAELSWVKPAVVQSAAAARASLGYNFAAEGCSAYSNGGVAALASDLASALRKGLQCLAQQGPLARAEAARLLAVLKPGFGKPALVRCIGESTAATVKFADSDYVSTLEEGTNAAAHSCESPHFPAFDFKLAGSDPRPAAEMQATMFHEMLHWLGYLHATAFDLPYLAAICCFSGQAQVSPAEQQAACKLLQSQPAWTSAEYQTVFARLMRKDRMNMAFETAWAAVWKGPHRDATPLLAALTVLLPADLPATDTVKPETAGLRLITFISGRAAMRAAGDARSQPYQSWFHSTVEERLGWNGTTGPAKRALAEAFSTVAQDLISGDTAAFMVHWPAYLGARTAGCAAFTAVEREWLERLARATTESVLSSMLTLPANPDPKDLKAREAVTDDWDKPCK